MGNSHQTMPNVEFQKDEKLKAAYMYSKYIEQKNFERALIAKKALRKKRLILTGSLALVVGIYTFTIFRTKQEVFLDDFEPPPRIVEDN